MILRENDNLRTCINRKLKRLELLLLSQGNILMVTVKYIVLSSANSTTC